MVTVPLDALCRRLGYEFKRVELAELALTHRSVSNANNERLEFLGDAVLGMIVADELYRRFGRASEGDLSRMRASLVKGATLAAMARELSLGDFLRLGSGELKSGGYRRDSILACSLEALIGAVYLDSGFEQCKALALRLFEKRLNSVSPETLEKDSKTRLQEFLQARGASLPVYQLVRIDGEPHTQVFYAQCEVAGLTQPTQGQGRSRRQAEQDAARQALALLTGNEDAKS